MILVRGIATYTIHKVIFMIIGSCPVTIRINKPLARTNANAKSENEIGVIGRLGMKTIRNLTEGVEMIMVSKRRI